MVKPNAAKHLLFAVSFLLFFFVFMGYRMRSSSRPADAEAELVDSGALVSGLRPVSPEGTVTESASRGGALRPDPSAVLPLDDEDEVEDLADWVPSQSGNEGMPLSLPLPTESSMRPSGGEGNSIAGLVPDAVRPRGLSLPLPSGDDDDEDFEDEVTELASLPGSLIPPGGGLKPPGTVSAPPAFLPPPPPGGGSSGTAPSSGGREDEPPFLPLPGTGGDSRESRPAASARSEPGSWDGPAGEELQGGPLEAASRTTGNLRTTTPPRPTGEDASAPISSPLPSAGTEEWEPGADLRVYVIRSGDTLSNIAARELGSASLADNIFLFNRDVIIDPDHLMVGQKIRLPARDGGGGYGDGVSAPDPGDGRRRTQGLGRVHRVARGDTLSSIALQYYGTATGWRFLYESNKNVVPDPNRLSVGTELTIPPYEQ